MQCHAQPQTSSGDLVLNLPPVAFSAVVAAIVALIVAVITNLWQGRRERARDAAQRQDQRERDRELREDQRGRDREQREDQRRRDELAFRRENQTRFAQQKREIYVEFLQVLDAYQEAVEAALSWCQDNPYQDQEPDNPSTTEPETASAGDRTGADADADADDDAPPARKEPGWLVHEYARSQFEGPALRKRQELRLIAPSALSKRASDCTFGLTYAMIKMRRGASFEEALDAADIDVFALIQAMRVDLGEEPEELPG